MARKNARATGLFLTAFALVEKGTFRPPEVRVTDAGRRTLEEYPNDFGANTPKDMVMLHHERIGVHDERPDYIVDSVLVGVKTLWSLMYSKYNDGIGHHDLREGVRELLAETFDAGRRFERTENAKRFPLREKKAKPQRVR